MSTHTASDGPAPPRLELMTTRGVVSIIGMASIRYSNPFFLTRRPAAKRSGGAAGGRPRRARTASRAGRGLETRHVDAVGHDLEPIGGRAERHRAPREILAAGRDEPGAVEDPPRRHPRDGRALRDEDVRSVQAHDQRQRGPAAAAITPPGTTQCPCITVARRFCATRSAVNHPAVIASGAAIHAAPFSVTSARSPAA